MSERVAKVESLIQQTVAARLPEILPSSANVTVTRVDASPDLRNAIVWVGILGDEARVATTFDEILELRPQLQKYVASVITTKFAPRLSIKLDTGGKYADHISRLLHNLD